MSVASPRATQGSCLAQYLANEASAGRTARPSRSRSSFEGTLAESMSGPSGSVPAAGARSAAVGSISPRLSAASRSASAESQAAGETSGSGGAAAALNPPSEASPGVFPAYDPRRGPTVTREMWTDDMLQGTVSSGELRIVDSPADFLNERLAQVQKPTDATVTSGMGSTSINPSFLSTMDQAEEIKARLEDLGIDLGEIRECHPAGGPFTVDWATEDRRMYDIGGLNVGLIVERYARYPKEFADQMMLDQWQIMNSGQSV